MAEGIDPRAILLHVSNEDLARSAITIVPVTEKMYCQRCEDRGWWPRVWQSDCPACYGEDPYGSVYCAQCEYCCGC